MVEYSIISVRRADGTFEHHYEGERDSRAFANCHDSFAARLRAEHEDVLRLIPKVKNIKTIFEE